MGPGFIILAAFAQKKYMSWNLGFKSRFRTQDNPTED